MSDDSDFKTWVIDVFRNIDWWRLVIIIKKLFSESLFPVPSSSFQKLPLICLMAVLIHRWWLRWRLLFCMKHSNWNIFCLVSLLRLCPVQVCINRRSCGPHTEARLLLVRLLLTYSSRVPQDHLSSWVLLYHVKKLSVLSVSNEDNMLFAEYHVQLCIKMLQVSQYIQFNPLDGTQTENLQAIKEFLFFLFLFFSAFPVVLARQA